MKSLVKAPFPVGEIRPVLAVMPTSGKFSDRVEVPHCTLGGLPDVAHSLPYFCLVERALGRGARRHQSGAVLAALGAHLWSVSAQSGGSLPSPGRWRTGRSCCAPFRSRPGIWTLGRSAAREGVATGGRAGRPVACPSV